MAEGRLGRLLVNIESCDSLLFTVSSRHHQLQGLVSETSASIAELFDLATELEEYATSNATPLPSDLDSFFTRLQEVVDGLAAQLSSLPKASKSFNPLNLFRRPTEGQNLAISLSTANSAAQQLLLASKVQWTAQLRSHPLFLMRHSDEEQQSDLAETEAALHLIQDQLDQFRLMLKQDSDLQSVLTMEDAQDLLSASERTLEDDSVGDATRHYIQFRIATLKKELDKFSLSTYASEPVGTPAPHYIPDDQPLPRVTAQECLDHAHDQLAETIAGLHHLTGVYPLLSRMTQTQTALIQAALLEECLVIAGKQVYISRMLYTSAAVGQRVDYRAINQVISDLLQYAAPSMNLGQYDHAKLAIQEAIGIIKLHLSDYPEELGPLLALALKRLGSCECHIGDLSKSLASTQEALAHYELLCLRQPQRYKKGLGGCLIRVCIRQTHLGLFQQALPFAERGLQLYRELYAEQPQGMRSSLAYSLCSFAYLLFILERFGEAEVAALEAVALWEVGFRDYPQAFGYEMSVGSWILALAQQKTKGAQTALVTATQAVAHARRCRHKCKDKMLAAALFILSSLQHDTGVSQALDSALQANAIWRGMPSTRQREDDLNRSFGLLTLAKLQLSASDAHQSFAAAKEALGLYHRAIPKGRANALAMAAVRAHLRCAAASTAFGRPEDALASARSASHLARQQMDVNPAAARRWLAKALEREAACQRALDIPQASPGVE